MGRKKKKQRAEYGSGYMRFDVKRNQFAFTIRYEDDFGEKKRKTFYGSAEAICRDKAENFLKLMLIDVDKRTLTIPDLLRHEADRKYKQNKIKVSAYQRRLDSIKIIEKHPIGNMPIVNIQKEAIEKFYEDIIDYSDSVIKKISQAMSLAYRLAIREDVVKVDLIKKYEITRPNSKKKTKDVKAFTFDEEQKLIKAVESFTPQKNAQDYRMQVLIALFTGMRMGEINALTLDDIDFENRTVSVNKTVSRGIDYKVIISTPKTEKGFRTIPLNNFAYNLFSKLKDIEIKNEGGYIFYNDKDNKPITTSQVNDFLTRLEKKNGLPVYSTHSLRHTFATRCIEAEIQAVVLKDWLGHNDVSITLNTYVDVFDKLKRASLGNIDRVNVGLSLKLSA